MALLLRWGSFDDSDTSQTLSRLPGNIASGRSYFGDCCHCHEISCIHHKVHDDSPDHHVKTGSSGSLVDGFTE